MPMDLTVANTNTRCYQCNSCGHEARDCATADIWRCCQAFRANTGANRTRWDGCRNDIDSVYGSQGTSLRLAAGDFRNIPEATVEDPSMNIVWEGLAVEHEVRDEEDGQGDVNWE